MSVKCRGLSWLQQRSSASGWFSFMTVLSAMSMSTSFARRINTHVLHDSVSFLTVCVYYDILIPYFSARTVLKIVLFVGLKEDLKNPWLRIFIISLCFFCNTVAFFLNYFNLPLALISILILFHSPLYIKNFFQLYSQNL